ncbi:glycosyltransferase family 4 protein [Moritella dasanensis]|uniref:glycosyltransferase family 4 protein n=1 Tax=Moritella dasanensis TaxID=428031 RepID=UPI0005269C46|nr:glycosyltransferase family 4 protein [Moritella dasanensis]
MSKKLVFVINVDWYFRLHWLERASYFKSLGYSVHIITNFLDASIKNELTAMGFTCHQFSVKRKSLNLFREFTGIWHLKCLLKMIKPDLIHCVTIKPNIYTGFINRFFIKKPIIYSITGLGAVFSSSSLKFVILRRLIIALYKTISVHHSKFIFENSEDCSLFQNVGIIKNSNSIVIKGAGIDLKRFASSHLPSDKSVLFAARLLKDKGLHCLIEAKKILVKRGCDFTLNVAGIIDSDVSSAISICQIEMWAKNGDINWLGNIKDMPNLIKQNDIVCLPTTYGEGVPRILIEAASCQRPIVTTDVAGCREIVSHGFNGLLAAPNDSASLANCLQELLESKEKRREFGVNGRQKVEAEFSQEMVFEKTLQVYDELLLV